MALQARSVLADYRNALDLLQDETRPEVFRLYWAAGVALTRAAGHVLQKVDGEQDASIKHAVPLAYAAWKADKQANAIFWDFLEQERNQILKEYEAGFLAGPIDVGAGGALHPPARQTSVLPKSRWCSLARTAVTFPIRLLRGGRAS